MTAPSQKAFSKKSIASDIEKQMLRGHHAGRKLRMCLDRAKLLSEPDRQEVLDDALFFTNHNHVTRDEFLVGIIISYDADIHATRGGKWTYAHSCAHTDFSKGLGRALKAGADKDAVDEDLRTPLMLASFGGNKDSIDVLLDAKADHRMRDANGYTAKQLAELADIEFFGARLQRLFELDQKSG